MEHIKLVQEPPAEPGLKSCLFTGQVSGPLVSMGFSKVHDLGWVLISPKWIEYAARAIGWTPAQEAQQLRDDLASARAENAQLAAQLEDVGLSAEKIEAAEKAQHHARGLVSALGGLVEPAPAPASPEFSGVDSRTFG